MSTTTEHIIIARFGRVFGVRGWLKVQSFTEPPEQIFSYFPWQIERAGQWQPIDIDEFRQQGKDLVVHIANMDDRDEARSFTNLEIGINREQLPDLPEGEYYLADLPELTVINTQGQTLGVVVEVFETGANDVIRVQTQDKSELLIPYIKDEVVQAVDLTKKTLLVDWDPGNTTE